MIIVISVVSSVIISIAGICSAPEGVVIEESENFPLVLFALLPAITLPANQVLVCQYFFLGQELFTLSCATSHVELFGFSLSPLRQCHNSQYGMDC